MEHHKWRQLQDFLGRNSETNIETLLQQLRLREEEARSHYFEPIMMSSDEFIEMLLLDGCFILELFLKKYFENDVNSIGLAPMSKHSLIIDQIGNDLLLLENQIPFFIVEILFNCLDLRSVDKPLIAIAAKNLHFLGIVLDAPANNPIINHLLQLVHHLCIASNSGGQIEESSYISNPIPSAKRLQEAGITFKKKASATSTFIDITFDKGVLEIPLISVADSTGRQLMNMVAFEQSNLPVDKRLLTCYMIFMDYIIDTTEDVEILEQKGILKSYLNSDSETALFFNSIVDYAVINFRRNYLASVIYEVNKYTRSSWRRWSADFVRAYIFSPWAIFSLIAALLLLSLTFIQTFCTVYPCNKQ